jgi:hypothetical protein
MWQVDLNQLSVLRGGGGEPFLRFVTSLVRAEAALAGLPPSEIDSTQRANLPDGGVDLVVRARVPADRSGWLGEPTCWQVKAQSAAEISDADLRREVHKTHTRELIRQGHAYRFCLIGDVTPARKDAWESLLLTEARGIAPDTRVPRVVDGEALCAWAGRFPGVQLAHLGDRGGPAFDLDTWRRQITSLTARYVEVESWQPVADEVRRHVDFSTRPMEPCLPVRGVSGVGKTRLVFETLAAANVADLVVYTSDEQIAKDLAYRIARQRIAAVLVADECSARARLEINNTLSGETGHVRVICIDNAAERLRSVASESWLETMPEESAAAVLAANFPAVPPERRRLYVRLTRGFIRFAADMCARDPEGFSVALPPALASVEEYVRRRLPEPHLRVLEAVALLPRVGCWGDVAGELDVLCGAVGLRPDEVRETGERIRGAPGFVARAGRYLYVTPHIVTQVVFRSAWRRWVAPDPVRFLGLLDGETLARLLEQVAVHGDEEIRRESAGFFRRFLDDIGVEDLAAPAPLGVVESLVEARPSDHLPWLRRLLESASPAAIAALGGNEPGASTSPARRRLVWLAERLLSFPEWFRDAEAILWALASQETETYGNNASAIWKQAFRIVLSGTSVPFDERLPLLEARAREADAAQEQLVTGAFEGIFGLRPLRAVSFSLVAGRVPPRDWAPESRDAEERCHMAALDGLQRLLDGARPEFRERLRGMLVERLGEFVGRGLVERLRPLLPTEELSPDLRLTLIRGLEDMVEGTSIQGPRVERWNAAMRPAIEHWLDEVRPRDLHSTLVATISRSPWDLALHTSEGEWHPKLRALAEELLDPSRLQPELPFLVSPQATSAVGLGDVLGALDEGARLLALIADASGEGSSLGLLRGYLYSLLRRHPRHTSAVAAVLDALTAQRPREAFELLPYLGERVGALERALCIVDEGAVDAEALTAFAHFDPLSVAATRSILSRLVPRIQVHPGSLAATLRFLSTLRMRGLDLASDPELTAPAWLLVEGFARIAERAEAGLAWEWQQLLLALAPADAPRAARAAASVLPADVATSDHEDTAEETLRHLAAHAPEAVMQAFGDELLDERTGWRLQLSGHKRLVAALPVEAVGAWLERTGVEGARRLARHVPDPVLDDGGRPMVAAVTELLLTRHGDDRETFSNFCTGVHGFETFWGSEAEHARKHADVARRFLDHAHPRIREWAEREIRIQEARARRSDHEEQEFQAFGR